MGQTWIQLSTLLFHYWIHPGLETGPPWARLGSFWIPRGSLRGPPWVNLGTKLDQTWIRATGITPMNWVALLNWVALPIWDRKGPTLFAGFMLNLLKGSRWILVEPRGSLRQSQEMAAVHRTEVAWQA